MHKKDTKAIEISFLLYRNSTTIDRLVQIIASNNPSYAFATIFYSWSGSFNGGSGIN